MAKEIIEGKATEKEVVSTEKKDSIFKKAIGFTKKAAVKAVPVVKTVGKIVGKTILVTGTALLTVAAVTGVATDVKINYYPPETDATLPDADATPEMVEAFNQETVE